MNSIILCEGKTDAILLSYYLIKTLNWKYNKNIKNLPVIKTDKDNEAFNWYENEDRNLAIWGCGGFNQVHNKFIDVINRNIVESKKDYLFEKLVFIVDKDIDNFEDKEDIIKLLKKAGLKTSDEIMLEKWLNCTYLAKNDETRNIEIIFLVIPPNAQGNLEVFLLNALKSNGEDGFLIDESQKFINNVKDIKYLQSKYGLCTKAQLGATLSVISPDGTFKEKNEKLTFVKWEKLDEINKTFSIFKGI